MAQKVDMPSGEHQGPFLSWLNISFGLTDRYILENYKVPFFKKHTIYILYKQDRKRCHYGSWEGLQQGRMLKSNFSMTSRRKEQIPWKIPMLELRRELLDSVCFCLGKFWAQWIVQVETAILILSTGILCCCSPPPCSDSHYIVYLSYKHCSH